MTLDEQHIAGLGFIESFVSRYPTRILETLLSDRTTGRNIIWADNEYEALGDGYMGDDEITVEKITGLSSGVIKPRIAKEQAHQSQRTKTRAEVFTPSWLVNRMNNDLDAVWFGARDIFNTEADTTWCPSAAPVAFPKRKGFGWHAYVESPRLEITCGEAPFVCSRYDAVTGDALPVTARIGFLDRKLRVMSEKTKSRREWVRWGLAALKASYGFEYQGDNLLLARINVFETFCEHLHERWGTGISDEELDQAAWIVSWNFWQMNGFTCAVPTNKMDAVVQSALFGYEEPVPESLQPALFDLLDESPFGDAAEEKEGEPDETVPLCVIYDWQENKPFEFQAMKGKACPMDKKFYAVIGNPPYQEESEGNQRNPPIYNLFMDEAYKVSGKVELITPARFLSDAGQTPKEWNRKMLHDPHLKVMEFEQDASTVFSGVEIKGGVAVTYRDEESNFGAIETFVPYEPLRSVLSKVQATDADVLSDMVTGAVPYKFTDKAKKDHPEYVELMGKSCDLRTNVLDNLYDKLFFRNKRDDSAYAAIYGLFNKKRECLWIERQYIDVPENFGGYKVLLSKANGAGTYGEKLSSFEIAAKGVGHTQSFVSMGNFETEAEAENLVKYLKTKFARSLLGILKVTQDISPRVWSLVPVQDFTDSSDIDWSRSVSEIDRQLYRKYGLSQDEIDFIESHVKEMD
ncbi:MAG: Eco57I restriction-modification methylase domain-containing protein [Aeriscardovia sp.]|nr:Eco57I restriction-modification methylase domain-containing protein [Aeriscardovia sp.]